MMDKLLKVAVITWAVFLALLAGMLLTTQAAEPETFAAPVKVDRPEPSAVVGEDPDEDALITAALEAQGYFRGRTYRWSTSCRMYYIRRRRPMVCRTTWRWG